MKKIYLGILFSMAIGPAIYADDALAIAKKEISEQVSFLKNGNFKKFKACFTARQQGRVDTKGFTKARKEIKNYTLDDLVESVTENEYEGKKTIKIKMKNGRTLTTLVDHDGHWLADTIWYR